MAAFQNEFFSLKANEDKWSTSKPNMLRIRRLLRPSRIMQRYCVTRNVLRCSKNKRDDRFVLPKNKIVWWRYNHFALFERAFLFFFFWPDPDGSAFENSFCLTVKCKVHVPKYRLNYASCAEFRLTTANKYSFRIYTVQLTPFRHVPPPISSCLRFILFILLCVWANSANKSFCKWVGRQVWIDCLFDPIGHFWDRLDEKKEKKKGNWMTQHARFWVF